MRSLATITVVVLVLGAFGIALGEPSPIHPLAPPDRSSPRATLKTFLDRMNKAVEAYKHDQKIEARKLIEPAVQCLNLQDEPPDLRHIVGLDAVLYLKEILDRIQLPPEEDIPDSKTVKTEKISSWTIPYTEITIAVEKEESSRPFLFTSDTIKRLGIFYSRVKDLPYLPGTGGGALLEQISSSTGLLVPPGLVDRLPDWMRREIYDQAAWKWVALALYCFIGAATIGLTRRFFCAALSVVDRKLSWNLKYYLGGLVLPIGLILFARFGVWTTIFGLHIISANAYLPITYGFMALSYFGRIWLVTSIIRRISEMIITGGRFVRGDMDIPLIRLGFDTLTIVFIVVAIIYTGARMGLPTYSLVTGLGIGGLAVALAGREALSNLIGTVMIILDRPFKIGDFIILGEGERGVVAEVGFRSTRIRTRDDVLISIPNSVIANTKMINESAPISQFRIRVPIGVGYESDLKQVEEALVRIAEQNEAVVSEPAPRVRFRRFGDSSLEFELLCWIDPPELKGQVTHQLNWAIYEEFTRLGIEIPFPQRDIHIRTSGGS
jgi:MscS family membrane protein